MHPAPMWPVKGHYHCPVCLRSYPVPWEQEAPHCSTRTPVPDEVVQKTPAPHVAGSPAPVAVVASVVSR